MPRLIGSRFHGHVSSISEVVAILPVNEKGLQHYVQFADDLRAAGLEPMITLLHWDLSAELRKQYGGMLSKEEFVKGIDNYARVMFKAIESKVKVWIAFNEPWCRSILGYPRLFLNSLKLVHTLSIRISQLDKRNRPHALFGFSVLHGPLTSWTPAG